MSRDASEVARIPAAGVLARGGGAVDVDDGRVGSTRILTLRTNECLSENLWSWAASKDNWRMAKYVTTWYRHVSDSS